MTLSWKIGGEAGFGITTIGLNFTKICTRSGYYAFDYAEFPSLIRGGFTTHEVSFSDEPIGTLLDRLDMLILLTPDGIERDRHRLTPESIIISDPEESTVEGDYVHVKIPLKEIKKKYKTYQVMMNTVTIGASCALLGFDLELFLAMIREEFARKGQDVINYNITLAREGYDWIVANYPELIKKKALKPIALTQTKTAKKLVMSGNDAFSYGAILAECGFYCAYPMSPSSTVLATLAAWQDKTNIVVRHCEDEVSVINQALGGSFAGVRSAVGTSGGGFALMVEGVSYAGIAEIPLVILLAQRPGPATGLPTWTAQGDLLFAVHAGHGEFPKIILAPSNSQEMIELTAKAFDLADIYQTPVIVLSDKLLSESHYTVDGARIDTFTAKHKPNRGKIVAKTTQNPYLRYKESEDGISELLIPGNQKGIWWQANSYEHLEDSHTTEDGSEVKKQMDKRNRKTKTYLETHFQMPEVIGDIDKAQGVLVSWGSTKSVILEAMQKMKHVACIHFTHMYPLDEAKIQALFSGDKYYILVENNATAQLGSLLRETCGVNIKHSILKYDGRPLWSSDIVDGVRRLQTISAVR